MAASGLQPPVYMKTCWSLSLRAESLSSSRDVRPYELVANRFHLICLLLISFLLKIYFCFKLCVCGGGGVVRICVLVSAAACWGQKNSAGVPGGCEPLAIGSGNWIPALSKSSVYLWLLSRLYRNFFQLKLTCIVFLGQHYCQLISSHPPRQFARC